MAEPIEIIDDAQLASYLGAASPKPEALAEWIRLTNGLVTEAWADPVDPIPYWVTALALEVAARPARNPKGLSSWTRSIDDGSRTERLPEAAARAGVFLTDDELRRLRGGRNRRRRYGTIRTAPGYP